MEEERKKPLGEGHSRESWERALSFLPLRIREAAVRIGGVGAGVEEIRIRRGGLSTLTITGGNVPMGITATAEEVADIVEAVSGGSLYAHADSIRQGVIASAGGIRCGIAGVAGVEGNAVRSVRDIGSLCLRLPRRRPGAADSILCPVRAGKSVLVWSKPGMGKTTILRELIASLGKEPYCSRLSVIDTRGELEAGLEGHEPLSADFYRGWPREAGMEAALRAMSPEILVCDELVGDREFQALESVRAAGVTAACSVHAGSYDDLLRHPLLRSGLFQLYCGILPGGNPPNTGIGEAGGAFRPVYASRCGDRRIEVTSLA